MRDNKYKLWEKVFIDNPLLTQSQIARKMNVSRERVGQYAKLLNVKFNIKNIQYPYITRELVYELRHLTIKRISELTGMTDLYVRQVLKERGVKIHFLTEEEKKQHKREYRRKKCIGMFINHKRTFVSGLNKRDYTGYCEICSKQQELNLRYRVFNKSNLSVGIWVCDSCNAKLNFILKKKADNIYKIEDKKLFMKYQDLKREIIQ